MADLDFADFNSMVRAHQKQIHRLILAMVRDPDDADALTQDTFVKAFEHRKSFRKESAIGTWLTRIAINQVRDHERSRRWRFWQGLVRKPRDSNAPDPVEKVADKAADPARILEARDNTETLWAVVANLSVRQRAAFTLRFVEEMSLEAIANAMGCEVGTVKSHLARALATIRREVP